MKASVEGDQPKNISLSHCKKTINVTSSATTVVGTMRDRRKCDIPVVTINLMITHATKKWKRNSRRSLSI